MENAKKTVLVTGGAGFIGSHLVEELLKSGQYAVYSLDNYSTGKKENHIDGATYIEGHTRDIEKLVTMPIDIVFHLGEYARVEKSFEDINTVWESNKIGTIAVMEFVRKHGCKIVYAGSSTKFGDGGMGRNQSPYAWSKASNTELVMNYGDWFEVPYAITYFYNVYGERELSGSFGTVIAIFKDRIEKGLPLQVVSPGTQERNFTYVKDIARALVLVGERGEGDGYGLGDVRKYSIIDIAKMFGGEIEMLESRKGNRMSSDIDVSRAKNELGWEAKQSVADYIKGSTRK